MDCKLHSATLGNDVAYGWHSYFSPEREFVENSLVFSQKRVLGLNLQFTDFRI
jgi:hypothetical protein